MKNLKKEFPPSRISDLDLMSASNFVSLIRQSPEMPLTILLGSGVSASAGLPIWNDLLKRICTVFFYHWEWETLHKGNKAFDYPPREMSIMFIEDFSWSDESIAIGEEFSKGEPTLVAQQIKNCIRDVDWRYLLYKLLYPIEFEPKESQLMKSLASLCTQSNSITSIVNYNYDSLFEKYLYEDRVPFSILWDSNTRYKSESLPIFHPHGYMRLGGGPTTHLILAESEYQRESSEPYSWPNLVQLKALCNSTCVFIGASMKDPNLRRLLSATYGIFQGKHFAFLPYDSSEKVKDQKNRSLFDRDLSRLGIMLIRYPADYSASDPFLRLPELIALLEDCILDETNLWE